MENEIIRKTVREGYAEIAKMGSSCCSQPSTCCGTDNATTISKGIGYDDDDLHAVPEGANLGLGCGNPVALASLKEGEVVLDLGSGAGFDCFLAAQKVGQNGKVIGIDMTPEMVERARLNSKKGDFKNVEFRLGEIENLPVADNSVDVIISNCVINLSPNKSRVFEESFRVLKPGGRLFVSDIVLLSELPDFIKQSAAAYVGCISGAVLRDEYIAAIETAGFSQANVLGETVFPIEFMANDPNVAKIVKDSGITPEKLTEVAESVVSLRVSALKNE